ncbi:hypothetical protein GGI19_001693 [Coemansia pectinata]|uniref:Ubiquitin carboxyl-terminal hydrolase n=1 Tax=Coemansia pectinata TaxID=1052879 RepID=A0A9W8LCZ8_9FUNG|nr:hypothetical protein GGI19_001693 [Coemansia pectinata]KAJ2871700.1 hypothetical protein GGH93_004615 [Coemansia aciculifera]
MSSATMASPSPEKASSSTTGRTTCGGRGCPHLAQQHKTVMERLKVLIAYAHVCRHRQALLLGRRGGTTTATAEVGGSGEGDRSRKRLVDEMPVPGCFACGTAGDRLHACLQCDQYACWRGSRSRRSGESHIARHLRLSGHVLALDFVRLQVFCSACGDYVHDAGVASIVTAARTRWHAALCDAAEPEAKRPRIVATTSDLNAVAAKYAREHGAVGGCAAVRGVLNLGATCYLSAVVQALAHNPVVRGWMLSDGHHRRSCSNPGACMACEIDVAIQALHGGNGGDQVNSNQAFAPVRLLRALWAARGDVAGAGQQDAHECLVAVLDSLHAALATPEGGAQPRNCTCLVHTAFAGVLQSAVTCVRCGNTTRSLDPMLDISLDIPPAPAARLADAALNSALDTKQRRGPASASMTRGSRPVLTLHDCLAHYTRAESLPPGVYRCSRCAAPAAAVKQLSVRELPPVLTFQLKRFAAAGAAHSKVDSFVRLPLNVDMTPYTAAALATPATPTTPATGSAEPTSRMRRADATRANPACQYTLFAVIDHTGLLDTGHYTAYARHRARWFRFDDAAVTKADIRDVLGFADDVAARQGRPAKGRAYMAFYVKSVLDYHDAAAPPVAPTPSAVPPASDDWVEDAGVVKTAVASGEVRVERRGRKKGSTNAVRKSKPKQEDSAPAAAEDGELPLDAVSALALASSTLPLSQPTVAIAADPSSEDSDGEALWARISKDKAVDDLVPMLPTDAPTLASTRPPPLFIDPAALMVNNHHHEEEEEEEEDGDNAFSDSE